MNQNCEIVRDLLPSYLENLCSDASRDYVEAHLRECEACRALAEETEAPLPQEPPASLPSAEAVLQRTSWTLHRRAVLSALGVAAIVLYWPLYLVCKLFADQGDYRFFSWSFWEVASSGSAFIPLLTVVWLAALVVSSLRRHTWRKNAVLGLILLVLSGVQLGYLHARSQIVYVDAWTTVESVPDENHIVISTDDQGGTATLETTPTITRLVKTDGTVYGFQYERKKDCPNRGILRGVWETDD